MPKPDLVRSKRHLCLQILIILVSLTAVDEGRADSAASSFEYGELEPVIEQQPDKDGYVSLGRLDPALEAYFHWKSEVRNQTGINYIIEDRMINQWGQGSSIYDNELNLIARWDLVNSERFGAGSINVWGQFAQSIGGTTGGMFQADLGILSPLNGGNSGPSTTSALFQMLAWEQIASDGQFRFQVGKLASRTLVNLNRYADGDSTMFFSPMLGNNTVAPYTALLGLGLFAQWKQENWYISGMVRGADVERGISFKAIGDGDIESVVEFALTPTIERIGRGEYRLTLSHDAKTALRPEVFSISGSFDQDIGDRLGAFLRFAHSPNTFRSFQNQVAAGFQVKKPFGFLHDRVGVGMWWGDPTDNSLSDEFGLELFYRAQVTETLEITPDVQFVIDPALSNSDLESILGLRLRTVL